MNIRNWLFAIFCTCIFQAQVSAAARNPEYPLTGSGVTFARGSTINCYEGQWSALPNFSTLQPVDTLWNGGFYPIRVHRNTDFANTFDGYIKVATSGTYTFYTNSNDGSRLYLGTTLIVDNDGIHRMQEVAGTIDLIAGYHRFTLQFFHATSVYEGLEVQWAGPSLGKQPLLSGGGANVIFRIPATPDLVKYSAQAYVEVEAVASKTPTQITLNWLTDSAFGPTAYHVYRKSAAANSWGTAIANVSASTQTFTDTNVSVGQGYEYKVEADCTYVGYDSYIGFVYAGIEMPLVDNRGKCVLIVDSSKSAALASELTRLEQDLTGDGWTVLRHDVSPTSTKPSVKALIQADYQADPTNVKALFIFGNVPVPYSGWYILGHGNGTLYPWPCDAYYGDMTGQWTDTQTPNGSNIPGDGKFDQTWLPADVTLQTGRVSFNNMRAGFLTETQLLQQYLNKDHNFRHLLITPPQMRAQIVKAGSPNQKTVDGYVNYGGLVGLANITEVAGDPNAAFAAMDHRCGAEYAGSPQMICTPTRDHKVTFFMGYLSMVDWFDTGSYDPLLREALAMPTYTLTAHANGIFRWYFHHMAMGETVGYGTRLSQNNRGLYPLTEETGAQKMAGMGDPTLRLSPVRPPSSPSVVANGADAVVAWTASTDSSLVGYYVYRAPTITGPFVRRSAALVSGTNFTDVGAGSGNFTYMVRAIKLETSGSGTYFNPSQGVFAAMGAGTTTSSSGTSTTGTGTTSSSGTGTGTGTTTSGSGTTSATTGAATVSTGTGTTASGTGTTTTSATATGAGSATGSTTSSTTGSTSGGSDPSSDTGKKHCGFGSGLAAFLSVIWLARGRRSRN